MLLGSSAVFSAEREVHCITCHQNLGDKHEKLISDFKGDVHREAGLSCQDVHGGNPNTDDIGEAKSPAAGFRGKPSREEMPGFCGRCHSNPQYMKKFNSALPVDQEKKYWTSVHGKKLKGGDAQVANCASCHPAHSIRKPSDPLSSVYPKNVAKTCANCHGNVRIMSGYKIPTDQFERYMKSVHAEALYKKGDLSAPTCNDCHGNHGAAPPGTENIMMVCGQCHAHNMEFLKQSPMAKPWSKNHLHMCVVCHNQHDVSKPNLEMLSGEMSLCLRCHQVGDRAYQVGSAMREKIEKFEKDYHSQVHLMEEIELKKGMDVTAADDAILESKQALFKARTTVHTFDPQKVQQIIEQGEGFLKRVKDIEDKVLREFWRRRIWLGLSTLLISFVIVGIWWILKEIERPK